MSSVLVTSMVALALTLTPVRVFVADGETEAGARARVTRICERIEAAAFDPTEPPLKRFGTDDRARARTAVLLLALASHETHLKPRIGEGLCKPWECDGGKAIGFWQLHAGGGLAFDGLLYRQALAQSPIWVEEHAADIHQPLEFLHEEGVQLSAKMALHMARTSIGLWTTAGKAIESEKRWAEANPGVPAK